MIFELINATYIADEDRLMIRINTSNQEEFRLWLTRRLCLNLLVNIKNLSLNDLNQKHTKIESKTIDAFKQETLEQQINLKSPYNPSSKLPFGATPILIKDITIKNTHPQDDIISINLILANNKILRSNMNRKALSSIRILLKNCCTQAHWTPSSEHTLDSKELPKVINLH